MPKALFVVVYFSSFSILYILRQRGAGFLLCRISFMWFPTICGEAKRRDQEQGRTFAIISVVVLLCN